MMKPAEMDMDLIDEMDSLYGEKVRLLCEHVALGNLDEEDNAIAMLAMHRDLKVRHSFDRFCAFVWLQTYATEPGAYDVERIAFLFKINDFARFQAYLQNCASQRQIKLQQEIDRKVAEHDQFEASLLGMTLDAYHRYVKQLQEDATVCY